MIFTHFGDDCLIEKKNEPIDVSALGFFDSLEFDCWQLIKKYADAFGVVITGFDSDGENDVSWDLAKQVQETILKIFQEAGIKFSFGEANKVTHSEEHYNDFERWAYEVYKRKWCEQRGYSPDEADENGFDGGEEYVCVGEYLNNEFVEEKKALYTLYEQTKTICDYMVKEGCTETTQGNWIFYFDELTKRFGLSETELNELLPCIVTFLEMFPEEVSDVIVDSNCIDINFYTNFCPNIETI